MTQVSWQIRAIKWLVPGTDIKADDQLIERVLKDLITNSTVYSYIVDYFKARYKLEEIAIKHNVDADKFVIIVSNTLNKLKQNGFLKYIVANGDNIEDLINQISYNTTRYHISYLPIPLDLISILDRRYQFTMISDLIDLYYGDAIPRKYINTVANILNRFHLIDVVFDKEAIKDEYPINVFRRLYFVDKNESITELPKNFEENIEYVLRNIGTHGDEFDLITMKYKEHKTYKDISIEMKCDEKDIQYAIDNIFRILGEPRNAKALALGIRPTIRTKKVDHNTSDTYHITESSPIDKLSGTLRTALITRLKENGINIISDLKQLSRMSLLSMNGIGDVSADEIIRVAKIYGIEILRYRKDAPLFKNVKTPGSRTIDKTRREKKNAEGGCLYHTLEELRNKEIEAEVDIWPINFVSKLDPNISRDDINIDGVNFILDQLITKYGKIVVLAIYKDHKKLNEVSHMIPGYNPSGVFRSVVHEITSNPVLKRLLTVSIDKAKEDVKVNPNHYLPENILMWGIRLYTMNKYINPYQIYSLKELLDVVGWTIHDLDFLTYDRIKKPTESLLKNIACLSILLILENTIKFQMMLLYVKRYSMG